MNAEADLLWDRWLKLAREARSCALLAVAKAQAVTAHPFGSRRHDSLWNEYRALDREAELRRARADVIYARYIVAKHGLNESDVFDVE